MGREVDRRDFGVNRLTPARQNELTSKAAEVSDRLPDAHRVRINRFDPNTGNPSMVISEAAPTERGNYVQRAREHLGSISPVLGFEAAQPVEFVADPDVQQSSSGAVVVHLQQHYKGIPIFGAAQAVRFAPDGRLTETVGSSTTVGEKEVSPTLSVQDAVLAAAEHVAVPDADEQDDTDPFGERLELPSVDVSEYSPQVIEMDPGKAEQPAVLDAGPFSDNVAASLMWFPRSDELRLAWEVLITMPEYQEQYRVMVEAESGEILYCRQLVQAIAGRGNVYRVAGGNPRQMTDFPMPLEEYCLPNPEGLPSSFPEDWVANSETEGNSVQAHLGVSGPVAQGTVQQGVCKFDPADAIGDDQKVLNIFYFNCYMHDYFYLLGFREADGNFEKNNHGRGGAASDRVDARAHPGPVRGTANMLTPPDGSSPVMNMGLVSRTNRHTAFDSSVVFHEYMHGLTNRLVGGPQNVRALDAPQSGGMGEGWGDYIACTINNDAVVGAWVVDDARGIRELPYDSNFPDNFGALGTGRYAITSGKIPVHNIGEIWCATLMEMNRQIGSGLGVQLVVDALKLSPATPSFLDMRNAILTALDDKLSAGQLSTPDHQAATSGIWAAFAKFGMGPAANSDGASLSGIVADFQTPP